MDMKKQVARLQKKLSKEFKSWVENETVIEMFRDDPPLFLKAYLSDKEDARLLGLEVDGMLTWHFGQYSNSALNEGRYDLEELALCAHYAYSAVLFEETFVNAGQSTSLQLTQAVFNFSLNVIAGWPANAKVVGDSLLKGLDTSLLDLRHTDLHEAGKVYRHFWFLLHLYCATQKGAKLDMSLYSNPEDMSPYQAVLADWRTNDLCKVQDFVSAMADFHVREAYETAHDEVAEFDDQDYMLFPHEILTFLRLREWEGLPNPDSFDHPLMQQPLAKLPIEVSLPQPYTPLLDQVINKFKQEYPDSFS
jgi:hypothetical protein